MKLPQLTTGDHALEGAPPGVVFHGRTRELDVGDLPTGDRFPCTLVGAADGVEVTMPLTIAKVDAPAPKAAKRRRRTAAPKAAKG